MYIRLGNITFSQVRARMGFELTEADKLLWDKFHNDTANLTGKESCFHIFDMPLCIVIKGEEALTAVQAIFSSDKLVEPMGEIPCYLQ
jgi:hypothetical protein